MRNILPRKFYSRPTLKVARELLGCFLIREYRGKVVRAMIIETEAYAGEKDLACHASRGRTPRTEVMYGNPGHAYVYMIYGMYHCLNVVTEKKDFPAAVLIRAVEVRPPACRQAGILSLAARSDLLNSKAIIRGRTANRHGERTDLVDGPGKLCKFLKIDRKLNKWDLTKGEKLWVEKGIPKVRPSEIKKSRRIGIDYAQHCREYLWRFSLKL